MVNPLPNFQFLKFFWQKKKKKKRRRRKKKFASPNLLPCSISESCNSSFQPDISVIVPLLSYHSICITELQSMLHLVGCRLQRLLPDVLSDFQICFHAMLDCTQEQFDFKITNNESVFGFLAIFMWWWWRGRRGWWCPAGHFLLQLLGVVTSMASRLELNASRDSLSFISPPKRHLSIDSSLQKKHL